MKKVICVLLIMLALPSIVNAEMVSVSELRSQIEALGRWNQTYTDAYGREIAIDLAPIIPNVDSVPILVIEKPEYTIKNAFRVLQPEFSQVSEKDFGLEINSYNPDTQEEYEVAFVALSMRNAFIRYDNLATKINKTTKKLESFSGDSYCSNEIDSEHTYIQGYDMTVLDCLDLANRELNAFFPEYNLDLDLTWMTVVPNTRPCYYLNLRQQMRGIPVLIGAMDQVNDLYEADLPFAMPETWDWSEANRRWGYFDDPGWAFIAYVDGGYQISFDPLKEKDEIERDVPLCGLDRVIEAIEQRIEAGNIRDIHALRFGYCCYINENDDTVAYPVWQVECDYFFDPSENAKARGKMEDLSIVNGPYYRTMIVNAQTGGFMDPMEIKGEILNCPEIITWEGL